MEAAAVMAKIGNIENTMAWFLFGGAEAALNSGVELFYRSVQQWNGYKRGRRKKEKRSKQTNKKKRGGGHYIIIWQFNKENK